ncbi:uncharacterized protein MEPE_05743 [Melanopsichium pennsylvanicum]|uniref:Copper transport protein n=1 Tax=Melanopsichium pennsylvanicum TaxID=63383 RepID=A0AAJ4XRM5_9BASI|nr:uncharacterized protein MEPE_05743 [Melanopsichium pennsylvanicum]
MDMSNATASASGEVDLEGWKPYLHTSLFSPFSNDPGSGEAFLFPTFRIYSRSTFLAACAFTFSMALFERWLTYLLDTTFSLSPTSISQTPSCSCSCLINSHSRNNRTKDFILDDRLTINLHRRGRANGVTVASETTSDGSLYLTLPTTNSTNGNVDTKIRTQTHSFPKSSKLGMKMIVRNMVYFLATLLRYILMIVGMGMDWAMLLSVVGGLTFGHFLTDIYKVFNIHISQSRRKSTSGAYHHEDGEQVELLNRDLVEEQFEIGQQQLQEEEEEEGEEDVEDVKKLDEGYIATSAFGDGGGRIAHRRNNSRQPSMLNSTPY